MRVKKKMPYYILGIAAIFALSLLGPLYHKEGDGSISVITGIIRLPKSVLQRFSAKDVFLAGKTSWMYTLMPIAAAIPSASYIYEELNSRFYMGVEMRQGKYRYVYSRFLYSALSGGAEVAVGFVLYAAAVSSVFPVNPDGGYTEISVAEFMFCILADVLYMAVYGMAMSVFASLMVYLYPNLYVDLSMLFIAAYLLRSMAMTGDFAFPLFLIVFLAVLYRVVWKYRSERI